VTGPAASQIGIVYGARGELCRAVKEQDPAHPRERSASGNGSVHRVRLSRDGFRTGKS